VAGIVVSAPPDHCSGPEHRQQHRSDFQRTFAIHVLNIAARVAGQHLWHDQNADRQKAGLNEVECSVSNFVNEDGLASLEYGAVVLNVRLIMVLGHTNRGAVNATIKVVQDGTTLPGHLPSLVDAIRPSVVAAQAKRPADLLAEATAENVRLTVQRLSGAKPLLADLVASGKLKVVGAVYDIASGRVIPV
jgi:carbonic anhydrase